MSTNIMNELKKHLNNIGYFDLYSQPELFNKFINDLDSDKAYEYLVEFNRFLRNKQNEDVVRDGMIAGDLTAATSTIRKKIISNLIDAIKLIEDNNIRAELVYYTIINLHMFSDGNGRTARLLFGLLSGKLEDDERWYIHPDETLKFYHTDFCEYKGICDEIQINSLANSKLSSIADVYKKSNVSLKKYNMFKTFSIAGHAEPVPIEELIPERVQNNLTNNEMNDISTILLDNEGDYSIAGLTMLIITSENGQLDYWISSSEKRLKVCIDGGYCQEWMLRRLSFNLIINKNLLSEWTVDDWKRVAKVGNFLKVLQFKYLNMLFTNMPEDNLENNLISLL